MRLETEYGARDLFRLGAYVDWGTKSLAYLVPSTSANMNTNKYSGNAVKEMLLERWNII